MPKIKKKRKAITWKGQILGLVGFLTAIVFMPTTIVLLLGMIPTVVAAVIDRTGKGTKALTVGSMNLAGCTPFLIDLWMTGHTAENAVTIISNPQTMVVIYAASGIGYLISWAMAGIVGTIMVQRGNLRLKEIQKLQTEMVERWGREVTGEVPLDPYGFPLEITEQMLPPEPKSKDNKGKARK